MKHHLRSFVFQVVSLWFTSQIVPTLVVLGNWQVLILAGFVLTILMLIVAPFLKILFIPLNFITFGLLSWLVNVIIIYLLTIIVPLVAIHEWTFPGAAWAGFVIPAFHLTYAYSLIVTTFVITVLTNFLKAISDD